MSLCLLMIFSCTKDTDAEVNQNSDKQLKEEKISIRSSVSNQCNLIQNGDFEFIPDIDCLSDIFGIQDNGFGAIQRGCVPPWTCYFQTADCVFPTWNWADFYQFNNPQNTFWDSYQFDSNYAFMCAGLADPHSEAFYQPINLSGDSDITYTLSCVLSSTPYRDYAILDPNDINYYNNGDLTVSIRFESDQVNDCFQEANFSNSFSKDILIPDGTNYPELINVTTPFQLTSNATSIVFQASTNIIRTEQISEGVFVDNVCITCTSDLVDRIDATNISGCHYAFDAIVDPSLNVVNYAWDFGQGPTNIGSSSSTVQHDFGTPGSYKVSVTVTDDRGCCTTVETHVYCGDPEPCDYLMCWAAGDDCDDMQGLDYVEGFTLIDANGVNHTEYFSQPIYTVGGYSTILNAWRNILQAPPYNVPPSKFLTFHPAADCDRVPDLFALDQVDIIMASFFGTKLQTGSGIGGCCYVANEIFFHSPDCDFAFEPQGCN